MTINMHSKIVPVGESVEVNCESELVKGYLPTTWVFHNGPIFGLSYYRGSNKILMNSIQLKDTGTYYCYGLEKYKILGVTKYRHFISSIYLEVYG